MPNSTLIKQAQEPRDTNSRGFACNTILFNCNCHSFDEVERQLIKPVHCSLARAREMAWKVHKTGSEVVYTGHRERCEAVAMVLEDIRLTVKVSE